MTPDERAGLDLGCLYMDLDSVEVDQILEDAGLDPATCSLQEAHAALSAHDPLRWAYAVEAVRQRLYGWPKT